MSEALALHEIDGAVSYVTLNRGNKLNALSDELRLAAVEKLNQADAEPRTRVVVLKGAGRAFCAGYDIGGDSVDASWRHDATVWRDYLHECLAFEMTPWSMKKPVIASVQGYALGGGCELAMRCDFIIAADNAKFGQPEINLGVMAGFGGTQLLSKFVGKAKSMEMHLTGRHMDAEEAERAGLVSRIVPTDDLIKEAIATALKIAEKSMLSCLAIKESINRAFELGITEGTLFERRLFNALFSTEDKKEGMSAFIEKRTPKVRDK